MKNFLIIFAISVLSINTAFATYEPQFKEEILNIKQLTPEEFTKIKKDKELEENLKQEMQQQGTDYMYRMQQQIMCPQNINPFGGYRF